MNIILIYAQKNKNKNNDYIRTELTKLQVTQNELESLPPMGELRRMVTLHCNHNKIKELPDFYGCEKLKEIHIANNCLKVKMIYF